MLQKLREQRIYRAIAFSYDGLTGLDTVKKLFDGKTLSAPNLLKAHDGFVGQHFHYYSSIQFSNAEYLEKIKTKKYGQEVYCYNMYWLWFNYDNLNIVIIAVPFLKMALNIFELIKIGTRGKKLVFHRVDIEKMIEAIKSKKNMDGHIKITKFDSLVKGDSTISRIAVNGADTIHSKTLKTINSSLFRTGVSLSLKSCNITFNNHKGESFTLFADRWGNYSIRIGKDASNLPALRHFISYGANEKIIMETQVFPIFKGKVDEGNTAELNNGYYS